MLRMYGFSFGVIAVALWFLMGYVPIIEGLHHHGLWPRTAPSRVAELFGAGRKDLQNVHCEGGTAGWDYICYGDVTPCPRGTPGWGHNCYGDQPLAEMTTSVTRKKFGVIGNPFADPRGGMELPSDQPTPPRDLVLKIWEDEYKRRKTLFNINGVSYKEMALRLGIDEKLAMRVAEAAQFEPFTTADDLLKFEGIDRSHVERWRPLIRFDNKFLTAGYPRSPVD
jgi:hypothetical protein